jgi:paired amphipathic helix protein Sin3a
LPPGYKIEPEDIEDDKEDAKTRAATQAKQRMMPAQGAVQMGGFGGPADAQGGAAGDDMTRKQPELDHARTYVKKIKMRFGSQPQIYKQFLEILHTFHREQHTIQDVYQQVAKLFKDHADLLSEFAQFLPDPSIHGPGGAPGMLGQPQMHHKDDDSGRSVQTRGRGAARPALEPAGRATSRQAAASAAAAAASQPPRVTVARSNARDTADDRKDGSWGSFDELSYFFRIKMALTGTTSTSATSEAYDEFLKVLSLFNQEIITRQELYILVKELLRGHDGELTVWFRNFLNVDDEDGDEPMGMSEVDWGSANKLGPSYREMPDKVCCFSGVKYFLITCFPCQKSIPMAPSAC